MTAIVPETDFGFKAQHEGLQEGGSWESCTANVVYYGPYANRWDFAKNALGYSYQTAGAIVYQPPYQYPGTSVVPMYAASFSIDKYGRTTGDPSTANDDLSHDYCWLTLVFETPKFDLSTYLSESLSMGGDMLTLPDTSFKFVTTGNDVDENVGKLIPQVSHDVTRHYMPIKPPFSILDLVGKCNNADFTVLDTTYPAGKLIFLGVDVSRDINIIGQYTYDWTLKFAYRDPDWNQLYNPQTGLYEKVQDKVSSNPPCLSADFSTFLATSY